MIGFQPFATFVSLCKSIVYKNNRAMRLNQRLTFAPDVKRVKGSHTGKKGKIRPKVTFLR